MLKTILIDDERAAIVALEHLLRLFPDIEIVGTFTDVYEAWQAIRNDNIQLVFLDIDMPRQNGIEVAKKILVNNGNVDIVFVTAYNQFAVDAFEVNVTDYILKPVSQKRLEKTLQRIRQKRLVVDTISLLQKRADFLNQMLAGKIIDQQELYSQANSLGIDCTQSLSLFFLLLADEKQPAVQSIMEELIAKPDLVVWKTARGICILDYSLADGGDWKAAERTKALELQAAVAGKSKDSIAIGIAARCTKFARMAEHYMQARNTAIIGQRVAPLQGVYHFQDGGFLPLLDYYIDKPQVNDLIASTVGKVIDYDRANGTELFRTMEQIILYNNLQETAQTLFIHYKTVQSRKQNIEKILGITMNSFAGRTMLGVALTLFYLRDSMGGNDTAEA